MSELQDMVTEWAEDTFPKHTTHSIAAHLLSEAAGLFMATGGTALQASYVAYTAKPKRITDVEEETADVDILALALAGHLHFDLERSVRMKMEINKIRKWQSEPNSLGFVEHVPDDLRLDGINPFTGPGHE